MNKAETLFFVISSNLFLLILIGTHVPLVNPNNPNEVQAMPFFYGLISALFIIYQFKFTRTDKK